MRKTELRSELVPWQIDFDLLSRRTCALWQGAATKAYRAYVQERQHGQRVQGQAREGQNLSVGALGFTLIELMITIAIIGVLAAVSVYGYGRYMKSSRIVEAHEMLGQIQMRQEAYYEANGYYCNASSSYHPTLGGNFQPKTWSPPSGWADLGVRVDKGKTYFSYVAVAGVPPNYGLSGSATNLGLAAGQPWHYAIARADMDEKGAPHTELSVTSLRTNVVTTNKGK